ncbi:hypothetical protein JCM3775_005413 [Rhodotorula graminis]
MSSEWDETCLVCCAKTKNRCSKCAEAGIDLFSCSPDHQKLVWNVHKRVCGPGKANPFVWPLLTKNGSREILEHMHEPILRPIAHNTVAKAVRHLCEARADQVRPVIEAVTVGGREHVLVDSPATQQSLLVSIRATEAVRAGPSTLADALDRASYCGDEHVWTQTAEWDLFSARDKSTSWDEYGTEPWRSEMRHLVLIHRAVSAPVFAESAEDGLGAALVHHRARLLAFVRTSVAATSPSLAGELVETMDKAERLARVLGGLTGDL